MDKMIERLSDRGTSGPDACQANIECEEQKRIEQLTKVRLPLNPNFQLIYILSTIRSRGISCLF